MNTPLGGPVLVWFRRDFRVSDHAALSAAAAQGRTVIPVFIHDRISDSLGAAPKWRLGQALRVFDATLRQQGSRLILRRGDALAQLRALAAETGATAVYWSRLYDPDSVARDSAVKKALREDGIEARSFGGHLMFEPWTVQTKTGGFYKVYTPFWNAVKNRGVDAPRGSATLTPPTQWPDSDLLQGWSLDAAMNRGVSVLARFARVGEEAAQDRLSYFIDRVVSGYGASRDLPAEDGTSDLSESLALGEISPHQCWHAGQRALHEGKQGAEIFLKELVWREFAYHLMHHTPHILTTGWRDEWQGFGWNDDTTSPEVLAWQRGRTGVPFVDAAMRQMYVTGRMHNRGRMIVASYLTKHLLTHWRIGQAWFADCLTDWDPASNAMGWQWTAGSGPDASPYFRIFNPETQLKKFDPKGVYTHRWLAEGQSHPSQSALDYFDAIPKSWNLSAKDVYPSPMVTLEQGRNRALAAYETHQNRTQKN